ncbi:thioredoxin-disulfide reductase [Nocardia sp. A7]|uniref:thioredoxin-disulfide reductase n=1 Tax=Nocardia sp. A7 TaxID=2789274 RepID=UPI0039797E74
MPADLGITLTTSTDSATPTIIDDDRVHDVIIVGSGPAGYTAAIYTARAELTPLVFEGTQFGGALMTTTEVENFPGFRTGITGPDLMIEMREQAQRFGADLRTEDVEELRLHDPIKTIVAGGTRYRARAVILAMGAAARYLGIPGEQELLGRGVSSCATCDGFFFRDHDIAVIGGGDSAMEEAIFLTKFARTVTVIHRSETFRASKIMLDRARGNDKITFLTNTAVHQVNGGSTVTSLTISDTATGDTRELPVTGVFVAIGHQPRSALVADQVDLDDSGYVTVAADSTATSISGVFAAGDLVDHRYRQAITAAGSGCAAAIDTERWLAHQTMTVPGPLESPAEIRTLRTGADSGPPISGVESSRRSAIRV